MKTLSPHTLSAAAQTPFRITAMPAPRGKDYGSNIYNARGSFIATVPNDFTQNGAADALAVAAFMVKACNSHASLVAALEAIQARVNGEFDHPALVPFGPLQADASSDCYAIAQAALSAQEDGK
jgi:hypothetical protein